MRDDRRFLLLALGASLLVRLQGLLWPLKPDESGYLLVARHWHPTPGNMYGDYWVDRPPILIGLFKAADWAGGAYAPRVVAALLGLLLVWSAYRIGLLVGGRSSARWAAVLAVAVSGQPQLLFWAAKSESLGVPLVVASCWLVLESFAARGRRRVVFAAAAGLAGALAMGMKQNLVGGAVFGVAMVALSLHSRSTTWAEVRRAVMAGAAGFALPCALVVGWALWAGVRLETVWYMVFGFRSDALPVLAATESPALRTRFLVMLLFLAVTGLVLVAAAFVTAASDVLRRHREVTIATVVMLLIDVVALALGGSYWPAYLTALLPGAVLAVAVVTSTTRRVTRRRMQAAVGAAALSTLLLSAVWIVGHLVGVAVPVGAYVGRAVGESASPRDTITVLYGRPDVVLESGLRAPYPQLWSLPARTLDPGLAGLRREIRGPDAPTWVVAFHAVDSFGLDRHGRLRALLQRHYVPVGEVCGATVLLRRDTVRPPLPPVDCGRPYR